jgi:hypothetical protein
MLDGSVPALQTRPIGASSRLAVLRVPVALQIGDQGGAEMAYACSRAQMAK